MSTEIMTAKRIQDRLAPVQFRETGALASVQAAEQALDGARKHLRDVQYEGAAQDLLQQAIQLTNNAGLSIPENLPTIPLTAAKILLDPLMKAYNAREKYADADEARANSKPGSPPPSGKYKLRETMKFTGHTFKKHSIIDVSELPPDSLGTFQLLIDQKRAVPVRE